MLSLPANEKHLLKIRKIILFCDMEGPVRQQPKKKSFLKKLRKKKKGRRKILYLHAFYLLHEIHCTRRKILLHWRNHFSDCFHINRRFGHDILCNLKFIVFFFLNFFKKLFFLECVYARPIEGNGSHDVFGDVIRTKIASTPIWTNTLRKKN